MKQVLKKLTVVLVGVALMSFAPSSKELPEGWHKAGSKPAKFVMKVDQIVKKTGKQSATIKSKFKKMKGFGTLMQSCSAKDYEGKRIKLSGFIKAEKVRDWAGLWLRIDGEKSKTLSFDNMYDRAIRGTTDWKACFIVLDVPIGATSLNFGALLDGPGQIWFDELVITEATEEPITGSRNKFNIPTNLNFEK